MNSNTLTKEVVFGQLESTEQFPINFDDAWKWLGFSRKDSAKRSIFNAGFVEGVEFHIAVEPTTTGIQAHSKENIKLTTDCFKMWAMMAPTEQGRQVRLWYLKVEKEWRQLKEDQSEPKAELPTIDRLLRVRSLLESINEASEEVKPTLVKYARQIDPELHSLLDFPMETVKPFGGKSCEERLIKGAWRSCQKNGQISARNLSKTYNKDQYRWKGKRVRIAEAREILAELNSRGFGVLEGDTLFNKDF